jgi:hypothetical protein
MRHPGHTLPRWRDLKLTQSCHLFYKHAAQAPVYREAAPRFSTTDMWQPPCRPLSDGLPGTDGARLSGGAHNAAARTDGAGDPNDGARQPPDGAAACHRRSARTKQRFQTQQHPRQPDLDPSTDSPPMSVTQAPTATPSNRPQSDVPQPSSAQSPPTDAAVDAEGADGSDNMPGEPELASSTNRCCSKEWRRGMI